MGIEQRSGRAGTARFALESWAEVGAVRGRVFVSWGLLAFFSSFAASALPVSCFIVHAEPTGVDEEAFQSLVDLVALADQHRVPLTLLLTAQWAEFVLEDAARVTALESFLARGHEIGAHHHAYWGTLDRAAVWDGYTDAPLDSLHAEDRAQFRGTMDDFWSLLTALPGARETGCFGLSEADATDWICDLAYSTYGHTLSDAVSAPTPITIGSCTATQVGHGLLTDVGALAMLYDSTGEESLFAVVTHVSDYAERPGVVERWFGLLASRDPEGARRDTVARAVRAWTDQ